MKRLMTAAAAIVVIFLGSVSVAEAQDFVGYRAFVSDGELSTGDGEVELLVTRGNVWGYVRATDGASAWLVGVSGECLEGVTVGIGVGREEGHDGLRWASYLNVRQGNVSARVFYEDGDSGDRHDAALVYDTGEGAGVGVLALTEAGVGPLVELNRDEWTLYAAWTYRDDNWSNGVVGVRMGF